MTRLPNTARDAVTAAGHSVPRLSTLFRSPFLRAVFAAAERDGGAGEVVAAPRVPHVGGGAARALETA